MIQLMTTLHILGARLTDAAQEHSTTLQRTRDDRGSVTIEQVIWAAAMIALAIAVAAAVKAFVDGKLPELRG